MDSVQPRRSRSAFFSGTRHQGSTFTAELTRTRLTVQPLRITTGLTTKAMSISPLTLTFNPAHSRVLVDSHDFPVKQLILSDRMDPVVPMAQDVRALCQPLG